MTTTSESSARRLAPSVTFTFHFGTPQHEVTFYSQYAQSVDRSELIFKVALFDADSRPLDVDAISWSFSAVAGAPYAYSPAGQASNIVRLPQLRTTKGFTRATLEPVRWIGHGTTPIDLVEDIWAVHSNAALSLGQDLSLSEIVAVSVKEPVA